MDGKFQEIMHMTHNLMFRMVITNGGMLWTLRLKVSKNTMDSRITPKEYQKIRVHFVFDVKHCGKFKARLVACGHLTKEPNETVY